MRFSIKRIVALGFLVVFSFMSLIGCGKEVYEDNRMQNSSTVDNTYEFNLYKASIVDSGYNWSSMYLGEIRNLQDGKVDSKSMKKLKSEVDKKIALIKSLKKDKIEAGYDKYMEDLTKKEDENKKFAEKISEQKSSIQTNIDNMLDILTIIKSDLSLGDDGRFDESEYTQIEKSQEKIIKIYNSMKQIEL